LPKPEKVLCSDTGDIRLVMVDVSEKIRGNTAVLDKWFGMIKELFW